MPAGTNETDMPAPSPDLSLVSFVIPTLNQPVRLLRCLEYIGRQEGARREIIVVNNGPAAMLREVQARFTDVRICQLDCNRGFAVACNRGIGLARGGFIALVNDDALLHPRWLRTMLSVFEQHPECTSCASNILYLDRVFVEPGSRQPRYIVDCQGDGYLVSGFGYKHNWGSLFEPSDPTPRETFGANAAASIYRSAFFDDVGLFDEELFCFAEDVDLSFRARLRGHRCLHVPTAYAFHAVRATAVENADEVIFLSYRNFLIVWLKNMPSRMIFSYLFHFLGHQLLVSTRFLFLPGRRAYYRGLGAFFLAIPAVVKKRRSIQHSARQRGPGRLMLDTTWLRLLRQYRHNRKRLALDLHAPMDDALLCNLFPDPPTEVST